MRHERPNSIEGTADRTSAEVDAIVADVLAGRARGEPVDDSQVLALHPHLSKLLGPALQKLRRIEHARIQARITGRDGQYGAAGELFELPGYRILQEVNRGGQAIVYLGTRQEDGKLVAIKVLHGSNYAEPTERTRLLREIQILQTLDHPSIVRLVDHGTSDDGRIYLVMNYVEGTPLRPDELAKRLCVAERVAMFLQICHAVDAAHQRGIIHRDLKPMNIRIDRAGRPHVLDFGLAATINPAEMQQSLTLTGEFVGTFLWASPEQKRLGAALSTASDVYSLGVLLHQLMTGGRFPPQVFESVESFLEQRAARPQTHLPAIRDPAIRRVIFRCLEAEPRRRFPDAGRLADALRAPQPKSRQWLAVAMIAALGLACAAGWVVLPFAPAAADPSDREVRVNGRPVLIVGGVRCNWIPPGEFRMGSPDDDQNAFPDELPARRVSIPRGFYIGAFEVTQRQFESVMGYNPSRFGGSFELPVERVSYPDAVEFCSRLSRSSGYRVRLPTEAEWEYACRAGATTRFHFGDDDRLMIRYGNLADLSAVADGLINRMNYNDRAPTTTVAGRQVSNAWHLYEMHGNVWEWCQAPYLSNPADPTSAFPDQASARGGSWWDTSAAARAANRNPLKLNTKTSTLGFRVVVDG